MLTFAARRLERRSHLYRQWASMTEAGLPVVRALRTLVRAAPSRADRRTLTSTAAAIERGATLSDALDMAPGRRPALDRALIEIGERTGRLDTCLHLLAEATRHQAGLLREVAAGVAYPVLVLHVAVLVFPVTALQALVLQGEAAAFLWGKLQAFAVFYLALGLAAWVVIRLFRGAAGPLMEAVLHVIPVLGPGLRDLALARLALALRAQLAAGITALDAWPRAAAVCGSPAVRGRVLRWEADLVRGATPGELAAAERAFAGPFGDFYLNGEISGKLDEALHHIERHYHEQGHSRLQAFARWLPRFVYLAVLLYVAYAVISFWSGYFNALNL